MCWSQRQQLVWVCGPLLVIFACASLSRSGRDDFKYDVRTTSCLVGLLCLGWSAAVRCQITRLLLLQAGDAVLQPVNMTRDEIHAGEQKVAI